MAKANGTNGKGTPVMVSPAFNTPRELPENAVYATTEIRLRNGLRMWVYEMSQTDYRRLIKTFYDDNPPPDRKLYERPVPEDEATIPGQTLSAESNPEYQEANNARAQSISDYLVRAYILGYTDFPDLSEDELIARFERIIDRKRKVMTLPDDAWEATLLHAILQTEEEKQQIVKAVEKTLAVEMVEVIDSVAIFRPVDPRHPDKRVPQETPAQSATVEAGVQQD